MTEMSQAKVGQRGLSPQESRQSGESSVEASSLFAVSDGSYGSRVAFSSSIISGVAVILDALLILIVGITLYFAHVEWSMDNLPRYLVGIIFNIASIWILFYFSGLYKTEAILVEKNCVVRIFANCGIVFGVMATIAFSLKVSVEFSRVWFFGALLLEAALISAYRHAFRLFLIRKGIDGTIKRRIAIVGNGAQARMCVKALIENDNPWVQIIGIFDDRKDGSRAPSSLDGIRVRGTISELLSVARRERVDDIVVALPWSAADRLDDITTALNEPPVDIHLASDLFGYRFSYRPTKQISGVPILCIFKKQISNWQLVLKEIEDKALALSFLILTLPLFALIAIAVRLESKGPIIFRQIRYGFNNQPIQIYKFRTMYHELRDEAASKLTTRNDPRVTKIGKILRRSSLDELPQIFNVLKGEMSMVGPRPHASEAIAGDRLYDEVVDQYAWRHKVKPGITGWAQINGWRGETDTAEKIIKRVEHDLHYINNWSIWLDLRILAMTPKSLLISRNAY